MSKNKLVISRRNLLKQVAGQSAAAMLLPATLLSQEQKTAMPGAVENKLRLPVLTQPDLMFAYAGDTEVTRYPLVRSGADWTASGATNLRVQFTAAEHHATVSLESPTLSLQRVHMRWKCKLPAGVLALGDAWERSYGDLHWALLQAERVMPWYAMLHAEGQTAGLGVKTGARTFAFWQVDTDGISLWLDVRNGGNGVMLGKRTLEMVTIVMHAGEAGESAFAATQRVCQRMAEGTIVPEKRGTTFVDVIYGSNDWYYAYGKNTADGILRDADLARSLAPASVHTPFTVIDDGYQHTPRFPDMAKLASEIRSRGVKPGIWIRPLRASATTPGNWLLPNERWKGDAGKTPLAYDPTVPDAMEAIAAVAKEACGWGYELIKHDFSTFELFGMWGSEMGASPTHGDWHFNDRTLTNAEIVTSLYKRIRASCGEHRVIFGCNTIGHLSVGLFDASRTGDDVSGREWERTRRMGVNTLAYRLPQHKTFFRLDADCVPLTAEVSWSMSRKWLQAVAASGTVLLVSPEQSSMGQEQRDAIREAFELCVNKPQSEPLDWVQTRTPTTWRSSAETKTYDWILEEGESPFPIGVQRGPD